MATWPSGTKASTSNLDAGTDSPASARADLKTNVDNVNRRFTIFMPESDCAGSGDGFRFRFHFFFHFFTVRLGPGNRSMLFRVRIIHKYI